MSWDLEKTEINKDINISPEPSKWKKFEVLPITDVFESLNEELDYYDNLVESLQDALDEIEKLSSKGGISLKTIFPNGYYSLVFIEPEYIDVLKHDNLQGYANGMLLDPQVGIVPPKENIDSTLDMFKKTFSTTTT